MSAADDARSDRARVIGLFGGSFDPVHNAHLEVARRALAQVPCDEVWFVPARVAPHKPRGATASAEHRVRMLEAAIVDVPGLRIETIEIESPPGQRMVNTVRALAARHPAVAWRLILGQDSWDSLETWVEPEALMALAPPVVQARPGATDPGAEGDATALDRTENVEVDWLVGEAIDLSSTRVRQALAAKGVSDAIPAAVLSYIRGHGLYAADSSAPGTLS